MSACREPTCELPPATDAAVLADVFKALADPTRIRLLRYLAQSEVAPRLRLPFA